MRWSGRFQIAVHIRVGIIMSDALEEFAPFLAKSEGWPAANNRYRIGVI